MEDVERQGLSTGKKSTPGRIILLNGASSSGKTVLARALQDRIENPFWHLSIDHFRDSGVLPMARIARRDFRWSDLRGRFFAGFNATLAACAEAGNDLIVEHILENEGWCETLIELLKPFNVYFIGVHCSLEELTRREVARGDRLLGSAARDFHSVHIGRCYDIEVQSEAGVTVNIPKLLDGWRSGCRQSDFSPRP
jgi:chloramphenicol 3-O phosphotransferase